MVNGHSLLLHQKRALISFYHPIFNFEPTLIFQPAFSHGFFGEEQDPPPPPPGLADMTLMRDIPKLPERKPYINEEWLSKEFPELKSGASGGGGSEVEDSGGGVNNKKQVKRRVRYGQRLELFCFFFLM